MILKPFERPSHTLPFVSYTSIIATIAATHAAPIDARARAVILLRNMIGVRITLLIAPFSCYFMLIDMSVDYFC